MNIRVRKEKMMKLFGSILLVLAVLFAQVSTVAAAPQTQEGTLTINGTVTEIGQPVTDENGVTTVPVTIETAEGPITIHVSETVANDLVVGGEVKDLVVNAGDVVPPEEEADVHPISDMLGEFFEVDAGVVDSFHTGDNEADQVFGFGVIAQALWMATEDAEDGTHNTDLTLATAILEAKASGDYEAVAALLGMEEVPSNWGQFKKAAQDKHENLGAAHGNDEDKQNGQDKDNGKGNDKNNKNDKKPKKNK
jgi:hypothetical protein